MKQLFYKIIYGEKINYLLRNLNSLLSKFFPGIVKIHPSGTISIIEGNNKILFRTNQTNYVTFLIFWKGYKNFEYSSIFVDLVTRISNFYDVGANIGYYSLLASALNPSMRIVSFEPAEGPYHFLKKNAKINHSENIIIEKIALSERRGEIEFKEVKNTKYTYLKHNLSGEGNTGSKNTDKKFISYKVRTTTVDKYLESNSPSSPLDLIKIDTEGTEHLILENAHHVLSKHRPIVICETLYNTIEDKLEEIMDNHDYEFYNHTPEGLQKVNTIKRKFDNGVRNCFFVHPDKFHLIEKFIIA